MRQTGYTEMCDIWSLGVTLYVMASALYPFYGDTMEDSLW